MLVLEVFYIHDIETFSHAITSLPPKKQSHVNSNVNAYRSFIAFYQNVLLISSAEVYTTQAANIYLKFP